MQVPPWLKEVLENKFPHDRLFAWEVADKVLAELSRLEIYAQTTSVELTDLPLYVAEKELRLRYLRFALVKSKGNIPAAAKILDISRHAMYNYVVRMDLTEFANTYRDKAIEDAT